MTNTVMGFTEVASSCPGRRGLGLQLAGGEVSFWGTQGHAMITDRVHWLGGVLQRPLGCGGAKAAPWPALVLRLHRQWQCFKLCTASRSGCAMLDLAHLFFDTLDCGCPSSSLHSSLSPSLVFPLPLPPCLPSLNACLKYLTPSCHPCSVSFSVLTAKFIRRWSQCHR